MDASDPHLIESLLSAYRAGAFPMAHPRTGRIDFYTADPRALVPLDDRFHTPRSVARDIRRRRFTLRTDADFPAVVAGCAAPRRHASPEDAWLTDTIAEWAIALHHAGAAHSLEAWAHDEHGVPALVGGIYGVSLGAAFLGESMFHRAQPRLPSGDRHPADGSGASAVCLVALHRHLRRLGYTIFDAQIPNPHTQRFGLVELPLDDYLPALERAASLPDRWRPLPAESPGATAPASATIPPPPRD